MAAGGRGHWIKSPIRVTGGLRDGGGRGPGGGLAGLEADRIAPLFTLTPGLQEARGGHMPNSPGGQSLRSLPLTSPPAPPSPARYMSACGRAASEAATLLFSEPRCLGRALHTILQNVAQE